MRLLYCIIFSLVGFLATAQETEDYLEDYYEDRIDPDQILQDTNIVVDNSGDPSGFKAIFSGKPGKAALYSLAVPGWGQVYNGKIWKLPLVYGLEGAAIYYLINNRSKFKDFNACYTELASELPPIAECSGITSVGDAFVVRQAYRKQRELSYVFVIGAHLFQAFEAYIDRHLVDFDIDEDLSFRPYILRDADRIDMPIAGIYLNLSPSNKEPQIKFTY